MVKDWKISLPHSLGWFTTPGEPENGRVVLYSIKFSDIMYTVINGYPSQIRGTATIRKRKALPDWIGLPLPLTIWRFTKKYTCLSDGDYKNSLASEALNHDVVLDGRFMDKVCYKADMHIDDLEQLVMEGFSQRPQLVKAA